ncbi:hypothetical protein BC941DRAFT_498724 [Chlamydoabsidia padenii]|nr:hypothetical protein BC941DRAFT_498724 [Chlamydoabsidia padenii]
MNLDSAKQTKTIFGSLNLFDGSPNYKQRRRRTVSACPAINQSHHSAVRQETNRRHANCHLKAKPTTRQKYKGIRTTRHQHGDGNQKDQSPPVIVQQQPDPSELVMNPAWLTIMDDPCFTTATPPFITESFYSSSEHQHHDPYPNTYTNCGSALLGTNAELTTITPMATDEKRHCFNGDTTNASGQLDPSSSPSMTDCLCDVTQHPFGTMDMEISNGLVIEDNDRLYQQQLDFAHQGTQMHYFKH